MAVVVETTVGDFTIDLFINDRPRSKWNTAIGFVKKVLVCLLYILYQ